MTREENTNFENSTKCWTCDNDYVDKVTGKCRLYAQRL